ncbi:MAG: hypothetical protein HC875_07735 [Anaerolineales bacterium]|nr:hypothetical protein [Anaerolineales bacterium]
MKQQPPAKKPLDPRQARAERWLASAMNSHHIRPLPPLEPERSSAPYLVGGFLLLQIFALLAALLILLPSQPSAPQSVGVILPTPAATVPTQPILPPPPTSTPVPLPTLQPPPQPSNPSNLPARPPSCCAGTATTPAPASPLIMFTSAKTAGRSNRGWPIRRPMRPNTPAGSITATVLPSTPATGPATWNRCPLSPRPQP